MNVIKRSAHERKKSQLLDLISKKFDKLAEKIENGDIQIKVTANVFNGGIGRCEVEGGVVDKEIIN